MQININSVDPIKNSVRPGLEIKASLSTKADEIINQIWGEMLTMDGVFLSDVKFKEYWNPERIVRWQSI